MESIYATLTAQTRQRRRIFAGYCAAVFCDSPSQTSAHIASRPISSMPKPPATQTQTANHQTAPSPPAPPQKAKAKGTDTSSATSCGHHPSRTLLWADDWYSRRRGVQPEGDNNMNTSAMAVLTLEQRAPHFRGQPTGQDLYNRINGVALHLRTTDQGLKGELQALGTTSRHTPWGDLMRAPLDIK